MITTPAYVSLPGADIVAEARTWIGTPWHHQAPVKGLGCDCTGLVRGVINAFRPLPHELQHMDYARTPDGVTLLRLCRQHLIEIAPADIEPGDILAFRNDRDPQHMAIAADYLHGGLSMIHALDQRGHAAGKRAGRVVEHRLDDSWRRRIVGVFRVPVSESAP